jgi:hypothetical protein
MVTVMGQAIRCARGMALLAVRAIEDGHHQSEKGSHPLIFFDFLSYLFTASLSHLNVLVRSYYSTYIAINHTQFCFAYLLTVLYWLVECLKVHK